MEPATNEKTYQDPGDDALDIMIGVLVDPVPSDGVDIAAWNYHVREVVDTVVASFRSLTTQLKSIIYGPVASKRRRPRRIQRKIDKRSGRRSYPAANWRRRGHDSAAGT